MTLQTPPEVAIDASPLLVRSAGVKTYLHHWLRALIEAGGGRIHPYFASPRPALDHGGGPAKHFLRLGALYLLNRTGGFLADVSAPSCDVFHVSNLLRYPPRRPKLSATIHDLTSWIVPECQTAVNIQLDREFDGRVLKQADGLIAVSENTRRDAVRILGISPEKIRVIYSGVPPAYFAAQAPYTADKPYFLSVGTIEPRKNIDTLLSAWASLPADFRREHRLVIAGMKGWHSDSTMDRIAQMTRDDPNVEYRGYVPESEMPALTAGAMALIYVSIYEGFGIPIVQAMAAGCPVIASANSSLPEVAGDAAILVDARSVREIADAIGRLAESGDLRESMRSRGREQARRFTWERAARESLDYFAALSSSSSVAAAE